jgi:hypothetical protein
MAFAAAEMISAEQSRPVFIAEIGNLLVNNIRADWLNSRNFSRNLRDNAGDSGHPINTQRRKRLEIGLNTGASAAVGTCDG